MLMSLSLVAVSAPDSVRSGLRLIVDIVVLLLSLVSLSVLVEPS